MTWGLAVLILGACTGAATPPAPTSGPTTSTAAIITSSTSIPPTTSTQPTTSTTVPPRRVLVLHKTAGFRHDSIPAGIESITRLGEEHGFTVTASEDSSVFTATGLAQFDVIVFLSTTGDVLDGQEERAMEEFISAGHGFVGVHAAADTEYDWPWYGGLVGAYFSNHPAPQTASVEVVDPEHPIMQGIPSSFERFDEWYNFRSLPGPEVTILAQLDEGSYEGGNMGDLHPIAWAHEYDGGRSAYTAFGHTVESFSEPLMLTLLANAILWAAGSE